MSKVVKKSDQITLAAIIALAEPVTVNATVAITDPENPGQTKNVTVIVPAAAVAGDSVVLQADGTAPATASVENGTFLPQSVIAADYMVVSP